MTLAAAVPAVARTIVTDRLALRVVVRRAMGCDALLKLHDLETALPRRLRLFRRLLQVNIARFHEEPPFDNGSAHVDATSSPACRRSTGTMRDWAGWFGPVGRVGPSAHPCREGSHQEVGRGRPEYRARPGPALG